MVPTETKGGQPGCRRPRRPTRRCSIRWLSCTRV